jgi:hypothetical protein
MTITRGLVIGEPVAEEPGEGELLVDEVANDAALFTHPDIYWYADFTSVNTLTPGGPATGFPNPSDMPGNRRQMWSPAGSPAYPNTNEYYMLIAGWDGTSSPGTNPIVTTPFGVNALRVGSRYPGDPLGNGGQKSNIIHWRKYFNTQTADVTAPFTTPLGSGVQITEAYLRYAILLESSVEGAVNTGSGYKLHTFACKGLAGLTAGGGDMFFGQWADKPVAGSGRSKLYRYDRFDTYGDDQPYAKGLLNVVPESYLYFNTWHSIETYFKLNSTAGANDAEYRLWLDDVLVHEYTNFNMFTTTGTQGIREINHWRNQIFHGGSNVMPNHQMFHRTACYAMSATIPGRSARRIGAPKVV